LKGRGKREWMEEWRWRRDRMGGAEVGWGDKWSGGMGRRSVGEFQGRDG
jgi:hypothetical protein